MVTPLINSYMMEANYNVFKLTVVAMQGVFLVAFVGMYFIGRGLAPDDKTTYKLAPADEK